MAVTNKFYGKVFEKAFNKEIDFNSDTIKVMLVTSAYTFDQDVHDYKDDITSEVAGTGYTAGGATLANPSLTYTGATNKLKLDGDDVSWPASTITARGAVVYDSTPATDATRPVICFIDFGADVSTTNGTFLISWDANGVAEITVS